MTLFRRTQDKAFRLEGLFHLMGILHGRILLYIIQQKTEERDIWMSVGKRGQPDLWGWL